MERKRENQRSIEAMNLQQKQKSDADTIVQGYDEYMQKMKDATGVGDVNEIIQKFAT